MTSGIGKFQEFFPHFFALRIPLGRQYPQPVNIDKRILYLVLLTKDTFNLEAKFLMKLDYRRIEGKNFTAELVQL